jgi:hypothetical protein
MRRLTQGRAGMAAAFVLGLLIATAGTATAARLITGKQIRDGSITQRDLAKSVRAQLTRAGAPGPKGETGPAGDAGPTGPAGRSALAPLRSGEVLRGSVGGQVTLAAGDESYVVETLPIPAAEELTDGKVIVDGPYEDVGDLCKGSFAAPTAPAGRLCIYGSQGAAVGTNSEDEEGTGAGGINGPATPYGFALRFYATATGRVSVFATWAYTAP